MSNKEITPARKGGCSVFDKDVVLIDNYSKRISVAPMLDWTDRHCRYFHRLLNKDICLYTEMISTAALYYGDNNTIARHLDFDPLELPLVLQLGGSDLKQLTNAAKLAKKWGYSAINLNCGCPSNKVQKGCFGAALMEKPHHVAKSVRVMRQACELELPVTVKHRLGINNIENYEFVRDFVGVVSEAGCQTFIVHARNALLNGISPKENRSIPPLKYDYAYRLKRDFPQLKFILNGGIESILSIKNHLNLIDEIMLGRHAYQQPYFLMELAHESGSSDAVVGRGMIVEQFCAYMRAQMLLGTPPKQMLRHILGLYHGQTNGKFWRRVLSDKNKLTSVVNGKSLEALFKEATLDLS